MRRNEFFDRLGDGVRAELTRFGPQAGMPELVDRWPEAVGDAIARHAWPARIARNGTVHVNTSDSVWAFELGHRANEIAQRLGVEKLRFAPGPLPEGPMKRHGEGVRPTPEDVEKARALAADIDEETLRETVQKAISFALARMRSDSPT
ncbi:MAG TPA: DUF721 domain-containing protein [Gaiellaceae bacterium]|nr:DUF721 domain-containing protein [Gaiellaceae bacterium]